MSHEINRTFAFINLKCFKIALCMRNCIQEYGRKWIERNFLGSLEMPIKQAKKPNGHQKCIKYDGMKAS